MLAWHVCLWKRNKNKREDTLQVLSWPWCSVERRFACGASGGQAYGQQECVTWVLAHFRSPLVPTTTTICHYARMLTKKMEGSAIRHSSARSVFPTTTNKTLWTRHSHTLTVWMRECVCVCVSAGMPCFYDVELKFESFQCTIQLHGAPSREKTNSLSNVKITRGVNISHDRNDSLIHRASKKVQHKQSVDAQDSPLVQSHMHTVDLYLKTAAPPTLIPGLHKSTHFGARTKKRCWNYNWKACVDEHTPLDGDLRHAYY